MARLFILGIFLTTLLATSVQAATLSGRVIEINDGDVITVFNLNRPVRVRLMAVDAPELGQAFGHVARKHLSDLVYDKLVSVEYSGIAADGSLVGRVMLNSTDIGAQMIRDGAAWFDASNQDRLSVADREVYQQSQQAARSERRGLWEAENPVAPWEFVRARTLRRDPVASMNAVLPAVKAQPNRTVPELTNLTLMPERNAPPAPASTSDATDPHLAWAVDTSSKSWHVFKPAGENFSAEMPAGGRQVTMPVPFHDEMVDVNVYMVRDGMAIYSTIWLTAPSYGETHKTAVLGTLRGFLKGLGEGYASQAGSPFECEFESERNVSVNGYTGSEFDLPRCTVPGKLRIFTKVVGGRRQMYCGAVFFYSEEDPNVARFVKSFTAGAAARAKRPPRTNRAKSE